MIMSWPFTLSNKNQKKHDAAEDSSKIEVIAHKRATKRETKKLKSATTSFNKLFDDNGFTIKLYLASINEIRAK